MKRWKLNEYYSKIYSYILTESEYVDEEEFMNDWYGHNDEYLDPWEVYSTIYIALAKLQESVDKPF